ncbi:copper amine oxidase N-terminal domain-containing protein [Anaeropeptidivorans aminofermentans]|uniref:copper amine oxidase N-terminal domain-containing protein n=1 Tax=Anaeropeptidivorans aminofermentans TaxID=2934315 RepID=UPI002024998C|nr:copper amine oxidase N-terminal domain-containing protein [Anaeropeptidivorans aminofermentans]
MKRKLALLLAAVMAVTAFPMTAMAASENSVTRQAVKAGDEVLLIEERSGLPASGTDWSRIGHFKIYLKESVKAGDTFKLSLENAEFNFGGKLTLDGTNTETTRSRLNNFLADKGMAVGDLDTVVPFAVVPSVSVDESNIRTYRTNLLTELQTADDNYPVEVEDVVIKYTLTDDTKVTINAATPGSGTASFKSIDSVMVVVSDVKTYDSLASFNTAHSSTVAAFAGTVDTDLAGYLTSVTTAINTAVGSKGTNVVVKVFWNDDDVTTITTSGASVDPADVTVEVEYKALPTREATVSAIENEFRYVVQETVPSASGSTVADLKAWKASLLRELRALDSKVSDVVVTYNSGKSDFSDDSVAVDSVDSLIEVVVSTTDSTKDEIKAYDPTVGSYDENSKVYTRTAAGEVPYTLSIGSGLTTATVRISANAGAGASIYIPIVVELVGDKDEYRIRVSDAGNTTISETSHVFASKADGKTKAYVKDTVTARSQFELKRIIIEEKKLASIKDGSFYLKAPKGYEFTSVSKIKIGIEPGLSGNISASTVDYDDRRDKIDHSTLLFNIKGINQSTDVKGALYIEGVVLVAEDEETIKTGDVNLTIDNYGSSTIYTEESFKVATASDYTIELKRTKDAIPTLVSGRLEGNVKYADNKKAFAGMDDNLDDEYHKAARVKVSEKIPAAWWAERTTKLTLPEDVTILKAKFDKITNLIDDSKTALQEGTTGDKDAIYYNTQKKVNRVTVDDNELIITNLKIEKDKKASFELDLWLGMAVNFEGDIDLTLSGSAVEKSTNEDYPKVTIAKAIKPVEVKVDKVSEVQVGYQYFTVSDFSITETAAGNLLKGKEVRVSITDGISIDMEIAKGFTAKVTEGDLKISNVTTSSVLSTRPNANTKTEGQITFEIDRESDEASTISFSNVQVKVSRNVPYSNLSASEDRGIDLVVWGNAIAQNYYQLAENDETKFVNQNDLFTVPGVSAKYINVVTVANDASSEFKNTVKVTIGNPVIKINDQDFTMPVAAYVSTASNSTMVPVRFVANALGLADETVKWDDANKTVTVDAGTRIVQFQIGNTNYLVNGVSVPMVSPDGLPVAAEITSERAFIPFRALGEAFNVTVGWDAATSTATYNAAEAK